jgi:hypothetical protein
MKLTKLSQRLQVCEQNKASALNIFYVCGCETDLKPKEAKQLKLKTDLRSFFYSTS